MFLALERLQSSWGLILIFTVSIAVVISSIGPSTLEDRIAQSDKMVASSLKNVIVVGGSYVGKVIIHSTIIFYVQQ